MKRFVLLFIFTGLISTIFAQDLKEVCLIKTFNSSKREISQGTGVFINGKLVARRNLFINAASATVITVDSTIHNLVRVVDEDPLSGITRFEIDNNLSTAIKSASRGNDPKDDQQLTLYIADTYKNQKTSNIRSKGSGKFVDYGIHHVAAISKNQNGAPLFSNGKISGFAAFTGDGGAVIPASRLGKMKNIGKDFSSWAGSMKPDDSFLKGLNALATEDWPAAASSLAQASKIHTNEVMIYSLAGYAQFQAGNTRGAKTALNKALSLKGDDIISLEYLGYLYFADKEYDKSAELLDQAINQKVENAGVFTTRGKARYELENFSGASEDLGKAITMDPENGELEFLNGNCMFRAEKYDEAIKSYDNAVSKGYKDAVLYNNRGKAKLLNESFDKAHTDFDQAILLNVDYAKAHGNRGIAKFQLKDWPEAIKSIEKAISLGEKDQDLYAKLADATFYQEEYAKAIEGYNKLVIGGSKEPGVFLRRGVSKYRTEDKTGAVHRS